jgi:hypothetical protein
VQTECRLHSKPGAVRCRDSLSLATNTADIFGDFEPVQRNSEHKVASGAVRVSAGARTVVTGEVIHRPRNLSEQTRDDLALIGIGIAAGEAVRPGVGRPVGAAMAFGIGRWWKRP